MKIIKNIDDFTLEHIIRPYQSMIDEWDRPTYCNSKKLSVKPDDVIEFSKKHPEWWKYVSERIKAIGFKKHKYHINHPLFDYLDIK